MREDLSCHGPDDVVAGFVSARDEGYDIDALELIPAPAHVVLGVRRAELREIDGTPLHGEIYNVFAVADGRITRIEDYADRDAALAAAGLRQRRFDACAGGRVSARPAAGERAAAQRRVERGLGAGGGNASSHKPPSSPDQQNSHDRRCQVSPAAPARVHLMAQFSIPESGSEFGSC